MVTRIKSFAFQGIDAVLVNVQVQIASGLPALEAQLTRGLRSYGHLASIMSSDAA